MNKILSITVIVSLTAWEGLFYVCNRPALGEMAERPCAAAVQSADALSSMFSLCNSINLQTGKLIDGADSGDAGRGFSGSAGKSLPPADVKIIKYAFAPPVSSQVFKSFGTLSFLSTVMPLTAGSGPPGMTGLLWLALLLFLCRGVKFCAYTPRGGLDATAIFGKTLKSPQWLATTIGGFSFVNTNKLLLWRPPC